MTEMHNLHVSVLRAGGSRLCVSHVVQDISNKELGAAADDLVGRHEKVDIVDDVVEHVKREVVEPSKGVHPPDEVCSIAHGDPTPLLCRPVVVLRQAHGGVPLHLAGSSLMMLLLLMSSS
jgi:hypothetical protein